MIEQIITVEYLYRPETGKYGLTLKDLTRAGEKSYLIDFVECSETFRHFTNKGKVSKPERSALEFVNEKAEQEFQRLMELKRNMPEAQKRADELAQILRADERLAHVTGVCDIDWDILTAGDFDDSKTPGWSTIKTKNSHSGWYKGNGFGHAVSMYYSQVPTDLKEVALELQGIRRKYQNIKGFDFVSSSYPVRQVREADHDNY